MSYTLEIPDSVSQSDAAEVVESVPTDPGAALQVLFRRCANQDVSALGTLYKDTSASLFAVLLRMLNSRELAEQALRDTFVTVWEQAGNYHTDFGHALTWMLNLARSEALEIIRSKRSPGTAQQLPKVQSQAETLQQLDLSAGTDTIPRLLQSLDEFEAQVKTCMVDAYCHGYSHANLATLLGKPVAAIKGWIRTGLMSLREETAGSNDDQWWNLIAGEYVLGTLDDKEHKLYESILQHDREFLKRVVWWQEKMAPLDLVLPGVEPPTRIWPEITELVHRTSSSVAVQSIAMGGLSGVEASGVSSSILLRRWRAFATLAAVGCVLLSLLLFDQFKNRPINHPIRYNHISVITDDHSAALWVIDASTASRSLRLTALAPPDPGAGNVYELWWVNPNSQRHESAGLLPLLAGQSVEKPTSALHVSGSRFVVTLEANGGSLADQPSGEMVFESTVQALQ